MNRRGFFKMFGTGVAASAAIPALSAVEAKTPRYIAPAALPSHTHTTWPSGAHTHGFCSRGSPHNHGCSLLGHDLWVRDALDKAVMERV